MKKAFTLVEILATIVIIAILAALLFPALRSTVSASKNTVCVSNLHQIQVAMTLYKDANGEYPPSSEKWDGFLPFLGGTSLKCPFSDIANYQDPPPLRVSYFLNGFMSYLTQPELDCRSSRGSAYPLVYDINHASPLVARTVGKRLYLYARVDGSVATEDAKMADSFGLNPSAFPCPKAGEFSNLK